VAHVADDADDLPLWRVAFILIRADVRDDFTDGIFIREVRSGKRFVDNGDADTGALILLGKVAALAQGNLNCLKVLRCDAAVTGCGLGSGFRFGTAFDPEIAADVVSAEWHRRDEGGVLDAGQCLEPVECLIHIADAVIGLFKRRTCHTDLACQHILRIEARRHIHEQANRSQATHD